MPDSFNTRSTLTVGDRSYTIWRLDALERAGAPSTSIERLPYTLRIVLENLLRREDGLHVSEYDVEAVARWDAHAEPQREISFMPARVLLQDLTGVPLVVDLAAIRDAVAALGGDPRRADPLVAADLVIDHSVIADYFGSRDAFEKNARLEVQRNKERYALLRWAQGAFHGFRVVPPDTGIVHQVNLEYLAPVVFTTTGDQQAATSEVLAYPDTLIGADSHTTMINGLGVLGWGVGGIEAEAAMLGQPLSMLMPQVVGVRLTGALREGATATDLVLTVTELLRKKGVVGKFVEFYGPGLSNLPLANRATIGNMSPEYGATCGFFPVDNETLAYMRLTGRSEEQIALVEAYCKEQGLFRTDDSRDPEYSDVLELELSTVEPSLAGPSRPQDRVPLAQVPESFERALADMARGREPKVNHERVSTWTGEGGTPGGPPESPSPATNAPVKEPAAPSNGLTDGAVVIAAITSCTNTSNPEVMVGAGLLAKKAIERGLEPKPWVKSSLAPGSRVVTEYLDASGLTPYLERAGFYLVGYGCTTCIGNSGPLPEPIANTIDSEGIVAAAVLSGNRNFEARIHPQVRANYLASPPLVVAYALAGRVDIDLTTKPLGVARDGSPVFLHDVWPSEQEVAEVLKDIKADMFSKQYSQVFEGTSEWRALDVPLGERFAWDAQSTYVRRPPFLEGVPREPRPVDDIAGARALVVAGDSVTTDHISPAGSIPRTSPAGQYLTERGVDPIDFNSYGARRGNHEVMMRGTFANVRFRNLLAPGTEGSRTQHLPDGEEMTIFDAAQRYREDGVPLLVFAGKEYGTGSSRDWAAKGTSLLGVRAAIAESFERIHRSNLIGMGVLPLEFEGGQSLGGLGLTGRETFDILGVATDLEPRGKLNIRATSDDGKLTEFSVTVRIDTPVELSYYRHGGILPYVLRQLLS
jgi:aconitate hydratase